MSPSKDNCEACGAPAGGGLICEHCGKPASHLAGRAEENRALDEYHNLLQQRDPRDQRNWLLNSGFLPDNKEVLIEAGIQCLPLLQNMSIYEAAAWRLTAVITKLELMHGDQQALRAAEDFRARIKEYKAQKRKDDLLGVGCMLLILAVVIGVGWWLVWDFGPTVAVPIIVVILVVIAWLILK
jgi:hypothetical protein